MFNDINPNIKVGVISSLIATIIFLYFLDPIISFLGKIFINVGSFLFQAYIDRIYQEIAVGQQDYGFMLYLGILIMLLIIGVRLFLFTIRKKKLSTTDKKVKTNPNLIKYINLLLSFFLTILSISLILTGFIKKTSATSFDQQIRIITPYISLETKDKIIADFSSMESRDDYIRIMKYIESIALRNNISLPPNRLYNL